MQRCSVCRESKPFTDFHRNGRSKSGYSATCKECAKARARKWFRDNQGRGKVTRAAWYSANRESQIHYMKKYWYENHEACLASGKRWREENKERKRAKDRAWQAANPEKSRLYHRVSRARRRAAEGFHTADDITRIRKLQRNRCAICRRKLGDEDHTDHITPLARGGTNWPKTSSCYAGHVISKNTPETLWNTCDLSVSCSSRSPIKNPPQGRGLDGRI